MTGTSMLVVAALLAILNQKLSAKPYGDQHNGKDLYDDQHKFFMKISTMAKIFMMRISTKVFMMMRIHQGYTCVVADIMIRMRKSIAMSDNSERFSSWNCSS